MAGSFDNTLKNRIQEANDIVEVISEHLHLDKKGREFVGLCPFHDDHKPSMFVSPVKQIFKCYACGAGGDVFKFIQLRENLTFPAAIERLAERVGIEIKARDRVRSRQGPVSQDQDPSYLAKVNAWAEKLWAKDLGDEEAGLNARRYVEQRQLSSESVQEWGIGLAVKSWDRLINAASAKKINEKAMLAAGLVVQRDNGGCYDKFRERLMFPIRDVTNRVIGFGGRTLGDDPAKYMNSPATVLFDKSNAVYGLNKARHEIVLTGTAVVVEGYTDVIMCHQFGCKNVVATLGTSFTDGHAKLLRRYAKRIVLVFDSDVAGLAAANRALEVCLAQQIDIKLAFVEEGKDPCDYLLAAGAEAFEKVLEGAEDVMEYKWKRLVEGLGNSDNITDKRVAAEEYLRTVATAIRGGKVDPIARGFIVNKLSGVVGLGVDEINRQIDRTAQRSGQSYVVKNQRVVSVDLGESLRSKAEAEILEVLINEPGLFDDISGKVTVGTFKVPILSQIAEILFSAFDKGGSFSLVELLGQIESAETARVVTDLASQGEIKGNHSTRLKMAVSVIEDSANESLGDQAKAGLGDDETESLRKIYSLRKKGWSSRRNPGMTRLN